MIAKFVESRFWHSYGLFAGRLIIAFVFFMAAWFKFSMMDMTVGQIAMIGFPFPEFFAWVAAILEVLLGLAFLTGFKFKEAAFVAMPYILFLAFAYHGPSMWEGEMGQYEIGFFVDHFIFVAALLYMLAHGPGGMLVFRKKS